MAEPLEPITSIRSIWNNIDYLSNWITVAVVAGSFSVLVSLKDKLTGLSIFISFFAAVMLAMTGWPFLLQYGYGALGIGLLYGMLCGLSGMAVLLTLIGIINRIYSKRDQLADSILRRTILPDVDTEKSDGE